MAASRHVATGVLCSFFMSDLQASRSTPCRLRPVCKTSVLSVQPSSPHNTHFCKKDGRRYSVACGTHQTLKNLKYFTFRLTQFFRQLVTSKNVGGGQNVLYPCQLALLVEDSAIDP